MTIIQLFNCPKCGRAVHPFVETRRRLSAQLSGHCTFCQSTWSVTVELERPAPFTKETNDRPIDCSCVTGEPDDPNCTAHGGLRLPVAVMGTETVCPGDLPTTQNMERFPKKNRG